MIKYMYYLFILFSTSEFEIDDDGDVVFGENIVIMYVVIAKVIYCYLGVSSSFLCLVLVKC